MSTCKISVCNKPTYRKSDYCRQHDYQFRKYGKIVKPNLLVKNKYRKCRNSIYVYVTNKKGTFTCAIDRNDEFLLKYSWYICGSGYPITRYNGNDMRVHKILFPNSREIDHIDRNKLNNRRNNLRECTRQENARNTSIRCTNKSGTKGVYFNKIRKKWIAQICVDYKIYHIGSFADKQDAIYHRKQKECEIFANFSVMYPNRGVWTECQEASEAE